MKANKKTASLLPFGLGFLVVLQFIAIIILLPTTKLTLSDLFQLKIIKLKQANLSSVRNDQTATDLAFPFHGLSVFNPPQDWPQYTLNAEDSDNSITFKVPSQVIIQNFQARYPLDPFPAIEFKINNSSMVFNDLEYFSTSGSLFLINGQEIGRMNINFLGHKLAVPILQEFGSEPETQNQHNWYTTRIFINPFDLYDLNSEYFSDKYPVSIRAVSLDDFFLFLQIIESADINIISGKDQQSANQLEKFKVIKIIDGDTIELENGQRVRYIGIDAPEIEENECYSTQASEKNRELVLGKEVVLEKDVSEVDDYKRLLRYVYLGDLFINEILVEEGFAKSVPISPDIKYQSVLYSAQKQAQENNLGLWGECL